MDGIVVDRRVVLEYVLGAVAMVNIEIDDTDILDVPTVLEIAGGNGHIVEIAEAHGFGFFGVVSRRADRAEGVVDFPRHDHFHRS